MLIVQSLHERPEPLQLRGLGPAVGDERAQVALGVGMVTSGVHPRDRGVERLPVGQQDLPLVDPQEAADGGPREVIGTVARPVDAFPGDLLDVGVGLAHTRLDGGPLPSVGGIASAFCGDALRCPIQRVGDGLDGERPA